MKTKKRPFGRFFLKHTSTTFWWLNAWQKCDKIGKNWLEIMPNLNHPLD